MFFHVRIPISMLKCLQIRSNVFNLQFESDEFGRKLMKFCQKTSMLVEIVEIVEISSEFVENVEILLEFCQKSGILAEI
jgi:hypothetical protein